jgi:amino acid transporter
VHPRFLTPANSIVVFGVVSFLLAALGTFVFLAATTILSRLLMYILVCAAVPRLRARLSPQGGFVLPGGQLVPILGIAASISLLIEVSRASLLLTAVFVLVGSGLYGLTRRQT